MNKMCKLFIHVNVWHGCLLNRFTWGSVSFVLLTHSPASFDIVGLILDKASRMSRLTALMLWFDFHHTWKNSLTLIRVSEMKRLFQCHHSDSSASLHLRNWETLHRKWREFCLGSIIGRQICELFFKIFFVINFVYSRSAMNRSVSLSNTTSIGFIVKVNRLMKKFCKIFTVFWQYYL